jgi:hypothetical protein
MNESYMAHIPNASGIAKYKATIDVLRNHLTGILIVKRTDSVTTRMVFVTELGMKMFDFEAKNGSVEAIYVFDPLNKPLFIESLKRNFNHMLLLNAHGEASKCYKQSKQVYVIKHLKHSSFYTCLPQDSTRLSKQETFYKRKRESGITYQYSPESHAYKQIRCKQYGLVKFYFELNAIQPTND